jgi:phospholipid/cholesterol/gamma-HCH transport system permease protein
MQLIGGAGRTLIRKIKGLLQFYLFSISTLLRLLQFQHLKGISKAVFYRQILFTGYEALFLIGFISISTSALIILEVNQLMGQLGKGGLVYKLLVVIVVHQLSSLFTALVLIARSGTAIATELGNMVVHKEIELLNSFGLSPFNYLVVPRVAGMLVSIFTLTIYFNLLAVIGGALFSYAFYQTDVWDFFSRFIRELTFHDFFMPVIKSFFFGTVVGLIAC